MPTCQRLHTWTDARGPSVDTGLEGTVRPIIFTSCTKISGRDRWFVDALTNFGHPARVGWSSNEETNVRAWRAANRYRADLGGIAQRYMDTNPSAIPLLRSQDFQDCGEVEGVHSFIASAIKQWYSETGLWREIDPSRVVHLALMWDDMRELRTRVGYPQGGFSASAAFTQAVLDAYRVPEHERRLRGSPSPSPYPHTTEYDEEIAHSMPHNDLNPEEVSNQADRQSEGVDSVNQIIDLFEDTSLAASAVAEFQEDPEHCDVAPNLNCARIEDALTTMYGHTCTLPRHGEPYWDEIGSRPIHYLQRDDATSNLMSSPGQLRS